MLKTNVKNLRKFKASPAIKDLSKRSSQCPRGIWKCLQTKNRLVDSGRCHGHRQDDFIL